MKLNKKFLSVVLSLTMCVGIILPCTAAKAAEAVTFEIVDSVGTIGSNNETPDKLIDGNKSTKWGVHYSTGDVVSVTIKASKKITVCGYSLTTGTDNKTYTGRNPKDWNLYGCNDYDEDNKTGTWGAPIDVRTDDSILPDRNKETFTYYFENETAYSYYKFEVTANKGADYMQLSEIEFLYYAEGEVMFTGVDGKNTISHEGYSNLFDKRKSRGNFSKWCVAVEDGAYVVAKAAKSTVVTGYTFTTGNDTDTSPYRNPRSWVLMGSNDYNEDTKEGRWDKLHSMTNDITMEGKSFTPYSFEFENSTKYQYYKLVINESWGDDLVQLCELEFSCSDCEHVFEYINVPESKCTEVVHIYMKCSKCAEELDVITPALGHSPSEDSLICSRCNAELCAKADEMYYEDIETAVKWAVHGGTVTLLDNANIDGTVIIKKDVTVDLNNHTLTQIGTGSIFEVVGYTFTLTDSEGGSGEIMNGNAANGGGVHVKGGRFVMKGGRISNCTATGNGGGVAVEEKCRFDMEGGTIAGCTANENGGGIYAAPNSTLNISGGTVVYLNRAVKAGGGIYAGAGLNVDSNPQIYANSAGDGNYEAANNIYLKSGAKISGSLKETVSPPMLNVTLENKEQEITNTFENDCSEYISSDDKNYYVVYDAQSKTHKLEKFCIVTFDYNAGDYTRSEQLRKGDVVSEPMELVPKEGCNFRGWYKDGMRYDFTKPVNEDITLTAEWTEIGKPIITLTTDTCIVSGLDGTGVLYIASYGEKGLIGVVKIPISKAAEIKLADTSLNMTNAVKMSAFLWSDDATETNAMVPLCERDCIGL